jgi:hypothetical protein
MNLLIVYILFIPLNMIFPEKCNYNQTINGCTKMGKIEGKLLFNWKNGRFCSKLYNQSETGIDGYL